MNSTFGGMDSECSCLEKMNESDLFLLEELEKLEAVSVDPGCTYALNYLLAKTVKSLQLEQNAVWRRQGAETISAKRQMKDEDDAYLVEELENFELCLFCDDLSQASTKRKMNDAQPISASNDQHIFVFEGQDISASKNQPRSAPVGQPTSDDVSASVGQPISAFEGQDVSASVAQPASASKDQDVSASDGLLTYASKDQPRSAPLGQPISDDVSASVGQPTSAFEGQDTSAADAATTVCDADSAATKKDEIQLRKSTRVRAATRK